MHDDQTRELSDEELIELRGGISRVTGALMRAWWLGMVAARSPEEQRLFDEIGGRSHSEDDELVPISDDEYLEVVGPLLARYRMLREAYLQGMITASTPDQERQLAELRELLD